METSSTTKRAFELLKKVQGTTRVVPVPDLPEAPKSAAPQPPAVVSAAPTDTDIEYDFETPTPKAPEAAPAPQAAAPVTEEDFTPEDPTGEIPDIPIDPAVDPKGTISTRFKQLRGVIKGLDKEKRKNTEELTVLRKQVDDYKSGIAIAEVTQAQVDRIAQLEVYEKLYNFKGSPVYQEKFAKPMKAEQDKIVALAKEHEIPDDVMQKVFSAPTQLEMDNILSRHFKNTLGAIEAKNIIKNMKVIQAQAQEAEKEPAQSLARMQEEADQMIADRRQKSNQVIVHTSKEAWTESLVGLREDERFEEITYKEGDTEHNEKYVRPILTKAAQEYSRTIKTLAEHGLTELPKDLAMKFARSDQLAHYSAVLKVQNQELKARNLELENLIKTKSYLNRPGVSSTSSAAAPGNKSSAVGAANAGARVLSRVLGT